MANRVFFAGRNGADWDVWLTDGTLTGTKKLHGLPGPAPTTKERRLAKQLFRNYCATCHGQGGKGDGLAAAALVPKPRDWTDPKWHVFVTDQRLLKIIRDGGPAVGLSPIMPPNPVYRNRPGVLKALVEIVRNLASR